MKRPTRQNKNNGVLLREVTNIPWIKLAFIFICAFFVFVIYNKTKDNQLSNCQVVGPSVGGIEYSMQMKSSAPNPKEITKILMVHGVGHHEEGYSQDFLNSLAKQLELDAKNSNYKKINLQSPLDCSEHNIGTLRVSRFFKKDTKKELIFFELTWSEITDVEKLKLSFDNGFENQRYWVNRALKKFVNDTGPDPIYYLRNKEDILKAFRQSLCWMITDWNELPDNHSNGKHTECHAWDTSHLSSIKNTNLIFVSHSLGSLITIDGLNTFIDMTENFQKHQSKCKTQKPTEEKQIKEIVAEFQKQTIKVFLLSNQLPMLQMGKVEDQKMKKDSYCIAGKSNFYNKRMVNHAEVIAFSDPNDLLSYSIPTNIIDSFFDPRLCADVTNVNIEIGKNMFGLFVNPNDAHTGYDKDERVIAIIAKGIGHKNESKTISDKCIWLEEINDESKKDQ